MCSRLEMKLSKLKETGNLGLGLNVCVMNAVVSLGVN